MNAVTGRIVVAGGTNKTTTVGALYESSDAGSASESSTTITCQGKTKTVEFVNDTWTLIPTGTGFVQASAIAYGGRLNGVDNPDVLYVASGKTIFLRSTAGGTLTPTSGQPAGAGNILAIAVDPNNWKTAVVTDGFNVFMTTDAGSNWTNVTGNLGNPFVWTFLGVFLSVIPGSGEDAVLFGDNAGVSVMRTSAPGVWTKFGAGLPNANTGGMVYNAADDVLVDGTFGRGAWKLSGASTIAFVTEGAPNSFGLGSFFDLPLLGPWTVDVNWGDSSATTFSTSTIGSLGTLSHTYGEEGTYTVTERVTNKLGQSGSATYQVTVADPAVVPTGGFTVTATEGALSASQTVATFTDPGGPEPVGDYSADINWGDGTPTQVNGGLISLSGGVFTVKGSHKYAEESGPEHPGSQPYQITVTIHHEGAPTVTAHSTATVSDPAVQATAVPVFGVECATFSPKLATFTDPGGPEPLSDYKVVSIDWGDSTPLDTTSGKITFDPSTKVFTVTGTHAYATEGSYTITVVIDHEGIPTTVMTPATIKDDLGLLLLDPTGSRSLFVTGNGTVTATGCGAVVVDSNNDRAAFLSGNATVTAEDIDVTGGVKTAGHGSFSRPVDQEAATPDPLGLALPAPPSPTFAAVHYSGSAPLTLLPGTYAGGIEISGSGPVTLAPGVYYMQGGGFSVTGQGPVSGTGVTIINAPGGPDDTIRVSGQGSLTLTAPTSGPFQGVTLFQDPASSNPVRFTGQAAVRLTGVAYVPAALVNIDGNANVTINPGAGTATLPPILGALIAFDLKVDGNGVLTINPDDPPSGPLAVARTAAPSHAGTGAVPLAAFGALRNGGGSVPGDDGLLLQVSILLSRGQQLIGNNPSPAPITPSGTSASAAKQAILDQLFSGNTGGMGAAPSRASTGVRPHRSMAAGIDPLSEQLVDELFSSLAQLA